MIGSLVSRHSLPRLHWREAVECALWLGSIGTAAWATRLWSAVHIGHELVRSVVATTPETITMFDADSLGEAIEVVSNRDLFRPASGVPGGPLQNGRSAQIPVPSQPRPKLILRGLSGGPPWQVVLEGVPGRSGHVVLRSGEEPAGLKIRAVVHDTVFLRVSDTTWRLTMKPQ